eukprot:scaffold132257_cov30-Tisochrysis_lutea.AAC.2
MGLDPLCEGEAIATGVGLHATTGSPAASCAAASLASILARTAGLSSMWSTSAMVSAAIYSLAACRG